MVFINGLLRATIFSPCTNSPVMPSLAALNFDFSYSSRTYDLTTLIPETFSCTEALRASYFLNTLVKTFIAARMIKNNPNPTSGMSPIKMKAIKPPLMNAITAENIIISGALTTIRIIIAKAICTCETSVVILVTKEAIENLSILANENVCNFSYKSCLKLVAKPTEAFAAVLPPKIPHASETRDMPTRVRINPSKET